MLKSQPPVPVNVTLPGNIAFTHDEAQSSLGWTPTQYQTGVLIKGENLDTETHTNDVKAEIENAVYKQRNS